MQEAQTSKAQEKNRQQQEQTLLSRCKAHCKPSLKCYLHLCFGAYPRKGAKIGNLGDGPDSWALIQRGFIAITATLAQPRVDAHPSESVCQVEEAYQKFEESEEHIKEIIRARPIGGPKLAFACVFEGSVSRGCCTGKLSSAIFFLLGPGLLPQGITGLRVPA